MGGATKPRKIQTVRVVEPHPLAARFLVAALERSPGLDVTASDVDVPALPGAPSVLVIDADALPFPLAAFLRTLRSRFPDARVLVIGKRLPTDELCRLLIQGVSGFVAYSRVEQDIRPAVEAPLKGHTWYPPEVLERCAMLSASLEKRKSRRHGGLTPREAEITGLLERRLSNKEIGCALGISERTVRFHLHNAFQKLEVHDRSSAAERAREPGFLETPAPTVG